MTDALQKTQQTLDAMSALLGGLRADELSNSTPCTEWSVKDLVNHVIGGNYFFAKALAGEKIDPSGPAPDFVGDNPAASYAASAKTIMDAWRAPGALERTLPLPFGNVPASVAIGIHLMDQLVHSWDLAKATGRDTTLDPELASSALAFAQQTVGPAMRGPGRPIGPEIPCSGDAPVQDRLVAFLGRQP